MAAFARPEYSLKRVEVDKMTETESVYQMEAGEVDIGGIVDQAMGTSYALASPATPPVQEEYIDTPRFEPVVESSAKKRKVNSNQESQVKDTPPSVNCFLFKSQLQEYCQKVGFAAPLYENIKEGRSHEPSFRSTVIVENVRYDSLPGFSNRKTAEQSAAEVALMALASSCQPVHETGLCKNLLQDYAQKMNYAIPLYKCLKEERKGKTPMYSCVIEVGGIKYIGASASIKKEAEIKAARTAMLAIQSAASSSENQTFSNSVYTVIPQKKKAPDLGISTKGPTPAVKPKKRSLKKKKQQQEHRKKRRVLKTSTSGECTTGSEVKADSQTGLSSGVVGAVGPHHILDCGPKFKAVVTDAVGPQVMTNGGSEAYSCSTTLDNETTENQKAPFDGCLKEGDSALMDAHNMI